MWRAVHDGYYVREEMKKDQPLSTGRVNARRDYRPLPCPTMRLGELKRGVAIRRGAAARSRKHLKGLAEIATACG